MSLTGPASGGQIELELEERTVVTTANGSVETLNPPTDVPDTTEKDKGAVEVDLVEKSDVERSEDEEAASDDRADVQEYPDGGLRAWR